MHGGDDRGVLWAGHESVAAGDFFDSECSLMLVVLGVELGDGLCDLFDIEFLIGMDGDCIDQSRGLDRAIGTDEHGLDAGENVLEVW